MRIHVGWLIAMTGSPSSARQRNETLRHEIGSMQSYSESIFIFT